MKRVKWLLYVWFVCLNALAEKVKAFFSKLHQNFRNDIRLSQSACDD